MGGSPKLMSLDVFKYCTALRGLGSIMILFLLGIVGATYYAVVCSVYGPVLFNGGLDSLSSLAVLVSFHFLLLMLLWSYFSVVLTDPGGVPQNWKPETDVERLDTDPLVGSEYSGSDLGLKRENMLGDPYQITRFCQKCQHFKPPRSHHCSVCARCILKMDHHCIWVVNCVGALNYKYFLLFLFYTLLETTLVSVSLLPYFIAFFTEGEIPGTPGSLAVTFVIFVLNLAFALSVMGFLIIHVTLVVANTTTIEAYDKKTPAKWQYDLGWKENLEQVLGMDRRYWFVPIYSDEDMKRMPALKGLEYPLKLDLNLLEQL